jgi:DNA-binding CsgD family transcriptional regulator
MDIIKNEIKRLWESGVAIETIVRSLPTTGVLARNTIKEMRLSGELPSRVKSEIRLKKIEMLLNEGYSPEDIGVMLSIATRTVHSYSIKLGHNRPQRNYKRKRGKPLTHDIISEIKKGDKTQSKIAREYGFSRQYIHQLANMIKEQGNE